MRRSLVGVMVVAAAACGRVGFDGRADGGGSGDGGDGGSDAGLGSAAFADLSVGDYHTCAVQRGGDVWCWGQSTSHEAGPIALVNPTPTLVGSGFAHVVAGLNSTCALATDGTRWCWGTNTSGEFGDGNGDDEVLATPTQIGSEHWTSLAGAGTGVLAVRDDGELWAFGAINATDPIQPTGMLVAGGAWESASVGFDHACAIQTDHSLWCWGDNSQGAIGNGSEGPAVPLTQVPGSWQRVAAGLDTTCAIDLAGALWCWGFGPEGQLGVPGVTSSLVPMQLADPGPWASVDGRYFNQELCAIKVGGGVWCWGRGLFGDLGLGDASNTADQPTRVLDGGAVSVGPNVTCAIDDSGRVECAGTNTNGELGLGVAGIAVTPRRADSFTWLGITAGYDTMCGVPSSGSAMCWGEPSAAATANPNAVAVPTPRAVAIPIGQVALGEGIGCGADGGDNLACWGADTAGGLGDGQTTGDSGPKPVSGAWQAVALGGGSVFALSSTGHRFQWGADVRTAAEPALTTPTDDGDSAVYSAIAASFSSACVLDAAGTASCWGIGSAGELGQPLAISATPVTIVNSATHWQQLAGGMSGYAAIAADGTLWRWGTVEGVVVTPTQVAGGSWIAIAQGDEALCAVRADQTMWCMGGPVIGNGTYDGSPTLVQVGADADWTAVAVGDGFLCGLKHGGERWCWGGGIGDGTGFAYRATFAPIALP